MRLNHVCLVAIPLSIVGAFLGAEDQKVDVAQKGKCVRIRQVEPKERDRYLHNLHFCVFDNGKEDYIYVGYKAGIWYGGEFELTIDGKTVFTGTAPSLNHGGAIIQMGDVLDKAPDLGTKMEITKVTGLFK